MIVKIKKFFLEVVAELKKVSWSTKQEIMDATVVVLISAFFLGLFIAGTDLVLSNLIELLIK